MLEPIQDLHINAIPRVGKWLNLPTIHKYSTLLTSCLLAASSLVITNTVEAQVYSDGTLETKVNSSTSLPCAGGTCTITGGVTAGKNLFHSFENFSVPSGGKAYFNNDTNIQNIISRVTGISKSNIDGTISANGTANVFLINPKGIVFGENAQLNIGGSFVATTANAMQFGSTGSFDATTDNNVSLLTVNPSALLFNQIGSQSITNQAHLQVSNGQSLLLVGGNVTVNGGSLLAPGGRVELGGLAEIGKVTLILDSSKLSLNFPQDTLLGNILLENGAVVDTSANGGGDIQIQGREITLTNHSQIISNTLGNHDGGNIIIRAAKFGLNNQSSIMAITLGDGKGSNLNLSADSVDLMGDGTMTQTFLKILQNNFSINDIKNGLFAISFGAGAAGELSINTSKLIMRDGAFLSTSTFQNGQGGNLVINATDSVDISDAAVFTGTATTGLSGDLTINTRFLTIQNGGALATITLGEGQGGNLTVNAQNELLITSSPKIDVVLLKNNLLLVNGASLISSESIGAGKSGNLIINTGRLIIVNGSQILTSTTNKGQAGNLTINAIESTEITGNVKFSDYIFTSLLSTGSTKTGPAGNLTINTKQLIVRDGAAVSSMTNGAGSGGNLTINASERVELSDTLLRKRESTQSGLFAGALSNFILNDTEATGKAGNIKIYTKQLIIRDFATINVSSDALGTAGNIEVQANSIQLDNGAIKATTTAGDRGNIMLQSRNIFMRHNGNIITNASGTANGGNITLNTDTLALLENSNIRANAIKGQGGNIKIFSQAIFRSSDSQIDASSQLGINGVVEIKILGSDPTNALTQLPTIITTPQITQGCQAGSTKTTISFVNLGTGGLPPNPSEALNSNQILDDLGDSPIVEAQGILKDSNGRIRLVATLPCQR